MKQTGIFLRVCASTNLSLDKSSNVFKQLQSSETSLASCSTDCFDVLDSAAYYYIGNVTKLTLTVDIMGGLSSQMKTTFSGFVDVIDVKTVMVRLMGRKLHSFLTMLLDL